MLAILNAEGTGRGTVDIKQLDVRPQAMLCTMCTAAVNW